MPGPMLHVGATVVCSHGGQAQPTTPNPRVLVSGQPTVLQAGPWVVVGCGMPPPPAGNGPCVSASYVTASVRVRSLGQPFVLIDSQAITVPTGTPLIAAMGQTRAIAT